MKKKFDPYAQPAALMLIAAKQPNETISKQTGIFNYWIDPVRQALKESPSILPRFITTWFYFKTRGFNLTLEPIGDANPFLHSSDSDLIIRTYVRDCCLCMPGAKELGAPLYQRFVTWYHDNVGENEPTGTWFGKRLSQYFRKSKREGRITYLGITIKRIQ